MLILGPLGFAAPWLLTALIVLPVLWLLLRAVPPAPILRRFPGVALLLGLRDEETEADKTPWWLLLLRVLAVAALILGLAGPVLNPDPGQTGTGPVLIVEDGSWASARDWPGRVERIKALLADAGRAGRPVALVSLTDLPPVAPDAVAPDAVGPDAVGPDAVGTTGNGTNAAGTDGGAGPGADDPVFAPAADYPVFAPADDVAALLPGLVPRAWEPDRAAVSAWASGLSVPFDTWWLSDGLARDGREALTAALAARGSVSVIENPRPVFALAPASYADGALTVTALRSPADGPANAAVIARGPDPAGIERELARTVVTFAAGADRAEAALDLPAELRNRVTRFEIEGVRSAGAVSLADDALRRREVALIAGREDREGLELLSPLHYLRQALSPTADVIEGTVADLVQAGPDVIILADVARITDAERSAIQPWVEAGGLLVRFAGPRLAASDAARGSDDPLLPVRLREGGRSVGGAMSWGEAKALAPFAEGSPFHGLDVPADVTVTQQVLAQPGPDLAAHTIAALADGTPLVTRTTLGEGQVVLFHVTANAEWSTLPLSGLFVQMLERLAVSTRPARPEPAELAGTFWVPEDLLDGFGAIAAAQAGTMPGVPGETLAVARPGPALPPGLYAGEDRRIAVNAVGADRVLAPAVWPSGVTVTGLEKPAEIALTGLLLALALAMALADIPAALWLSGRMPGRLVRRLSQGTRTAALIGVIGYGLLAVSAAIAPSPAAAQAADPPAATSAPAGPAPDPAADAFAIAATTSVVLAHVITGDAQVDALAQAGLLGLSDQLYGRTSVEPAEPMAVNLETDELSFFPFLYWPVTENQPQPSPAAYAKLNDYMRSGGMILFDTRDGDVAGFGAASPAGRRLQALASALDIPPLEPLPPDHVLTRAFYLLQDFPGRFAGPNIWVEAAPADAEQAEGMPFRNLNDGVTPVVIGGNDWASAWAVDANGVSMFPIGRGFAGERQREISYRFGVNLIMHVLTGNYKSDQVHVPALLERLGQ